MNHAPGLGQLKLHRCTEKSYITLQNGEDTKFHLFVEVTKVMTDHHQEGHAAQLTFQKQVNSVVSVFHSKGNPFTEDFPELVTIDTRKVLDLSVVNSLRKMKALGLENYEKFVRDVIEDRVLSIEEPLK